ncbi:hypothetical protein HZB88_00220 [archaeon]|nr:hypothetical protein [archaeon]
MGTLNFEIKSSLLLIIVLIMFLASMPSLAQVDIAPVVLQVDNNDTFSYDYPSENITNATALEISLNETIPTTDENITIQDSVPPIYSNFRVNNANPKKDEAVEFSVLWQDDFGLDKWIFSWNASGGWENETYSFVSSYDDKTQILTKQGWRYLKDLNYKDEIATLHGEKIEWQKPLRIITLPYNNGVYRINGEIDLLVTPDHEVYARVDNPISFLLNRIKDFFFGINVEDFEFIDINEAYKLTDDGYHLTFLDEKLKPVYVSKIIKEVYNGEIFDLTVPNHIVLVKRFGKAVWSSNLNVKEAWSNITKVIPTVGLIGYKFYASDLAGNWNETEIGSMLLI